MMIPDKIYTRVLLFFTLAFFVKSSLAWNVQSPGESQQCAKIFFQSNYHGEAFTLKSEEQFSDLSDIQYYLQKEAEKRQHNNDKFNDGIEGQRRDQAENVQLQESAVSFEVQEGCILKLSPRAFLKGDVNEYTENVENLPGDWLIPKSAACECPKTCKCEDHKLRNTECGRAYINDDCTICKAAFTSLKPGGGWTRFPEKWASNVKTVMLREGCELSIQYKNPTTKHQIFKSTASTVIKDMNPYVNISKYQCTCSERPPRSNSINTDSGENHNYPPFIDIPKSKGNINTLMFRDEFRKHPGLMASLQSLRNKRASNNAYILLLGLTGSGKSTAVNLLFDHPNITKVGDYISTTSDILEFSIPVPVKEMGMKNTKLHVIDTPGIGDTRGIAEDSRFLASLDDYLSKHSDLRKSLPNVVLIFSKFTNNRFRGEGSSFVKMLRTIDLFKNRIIDRKSTNVIFVLSHYMSETKDITRDPRDRINSIREVIEQSTSLPRPIQIVLAENKPEASDLLSINGFWRLPNGEFYPKNLFDTIQRNQINSGDPVGEAIIRTAFSNSDDFQITMKRHRLIHKSNSKVTKYLGILGSFINPVSHTEVSQALNNAYTRLDSDTKEKYPDAMSTLQRSLFVENILEKADLPKTSADILKLFEETQINPVSMFLLKTAFNITAPEFKNDFVVGSGYSLVNDETLPSQIFQAENVKDEPSDMLFRIPDIYNIVLQSDLDNQFQIFTDWDALIKARVNSLGLKEDAIPINSYNASLLKHPGYNLVSSSTSSGDNLKSPQIDWNGLTATVNYHTFQIGLNPRNLSFSEGFNSTLQSLVQLNLQDSGNVKIWEDFFNRYGTHVVTHAYGGGSITVNTEVEDESMSNSDKFSLLSETMANITQQLANELIGKNVAYVPPTGVKYGFTQRGGNYRNYWSNFSDLDDTKNIDEWKESLKYEPVILKTRLHLVPISEIVTEITGDRELGYMIEEAAATLLNASLLYIPMQKVYDGDNPEARDSLDGEMGMLGGGGDFESMQEFSNMFKTMSEQSNALQAQLVSLIEESKRKQIADEERNEKRMLLMQQERAEEDRRLREEERYEKELQIRREEMEMKRQHEDNALRLQLEQSKVQAEMQQQMRMAEMQSRNEQTMLNFINMENERRTKILLNKKSWLDKTFEFLGKTVDTVKQGITAAIPAMMSG